MDIEKLIVSLRSPSWQDLEDPDAPLLEDAAHALSTLQAENERLKNKLSELAHFPFDEPGIGERTRLMAENAELRAELEQVKRCIEIVENQRDSAIKELENYMVQDVLDGNEPCAICAKASDTPCEYCNPKWRGQKED